MTTPLYKYKTDPLKLSMRIDSRIHKRRPLLLSPPSLLFHTATAFICFAVIKKAQCVRIPLSPSYQGTQQQHSPLLNSLKNEQALPINWNKDQFWLNLIHSSELIEISSRGVRSIASATLHQKSWAWNTAVNRLAGVALAHEANCTASHQSLCWIGDEGSILPSEVYLVKVTGLSNPIFSSQVLRIFSQRADDACGGLGGWGNGRNIVPNISTYAVSSCDVLNGHVVIIYEPASRRISIVPQTFGPMSYSLIIVSSLVFLFGASSAEEKSKMAVHHQVIVFSVFSVITSLMALVLAKGIPFLTMGDEVNFWAPACISLLYTLLTFINQNCDNNDNNIFNNNNNNGFGVRVNDSCIYALTTIAVALYRTPETPYVAIIVSILAIKQWQKIFECCHSGGNILLFKQLDIIFTTIHLCMIIEVGLVPQFAEIEDWPVYAAVGTYITFTVALYKKKVVVK